MAVPEKRCLYEVLGLPTDCSADQIRSAYKRLALQRHPDKLIQSGQSPADATASFQELVNAYEVLSDPRERSWYDSHRSQILFSNPTTSGHSPSPIPNLFSFFSNSVYSGFSDSGKGFYKVYSDVFYLVYANEVNFSRKLGLGGVREAPVMGNLGSPYSQVKAFYDYWLGFVTVMDFCWVDQYDAMAGVNRKLRRVMEDENKKLRKKARREFHETVRGLAEFVRKRDKRVIDMMVKKEAELERRKAEERQRKRRAEKEKEERARAYQEPEWARVDEGELENGLHEMEDDDNERTQKEGKELYCLVCAKKFKSDKQWKNHEQSKKHKEKFLEFRESFKDDSFNEEDAVVEEGIADELENDYLAHNENGVDKLNEQFSSDFRIEEEEISEAEVSSRADSASGNGEMRTVDSFGLEDENSFLESMVSGHRSKQNAADKPSSEKAQDEFKIDDGGFVEYDTRKIRRRNKEVKREKKRATASDSMKADRTSTRRPGEEDDSNLEDPHGDSLETDDAGGQSFQQPERRLNGSDHPAERKKEERDTKPKNCSKGRKQKAASKKSSTRCDECGEDFESRNKLHKHLGESGHATLKHR